MTIITRLAAVLAAGFKLAAASDAAAWKAPRSASSAVPEQATTSVSPPVPKRPSTSVQLPPVALTSRQLTVFALGFVLAAAALAGIWMTLNESSSQASSMLKTTNLAMQPGVPASRQFAACPLMPTTAAASEKDGQFPLQADVSGLIAADIASFIAIGKEAVASGRLRDAEVAFLMSCRVADKLKGADSVESAEAKFQLGAHYARLALDADSANRAELLRQAELLYSDSSHIYLLKYGKAHEMSQFAAEGLATVRQTLALGDSAPLRPSATQSRARQVDAEVSSLRAPSVPQDQAATRRPKSSSDCTKARSVPEKMICSDAELARLDRDLARVYLRAGKLTSDRAAFRRQTQEEWRMREATCRDRECLLRWYAHRRVQLTSVIQGQEQSPPKATNWSTFPADTADLYKGR